MEDELVRETKTQEVEQVLGKVGRVEFVPDASYSNRCRVLVDGQEVRHLEAFKLEWK